MSPLYLGFDCSTQSLTAIVLDVDGDRRQIVYQSSLEFDRTFPEYGTHHGVLRGPSPLRRRHL
jgi:sugar (pentulose or hexulose) kinase